MVSLPWLTAVSSKGSMVSRPGNPGGGVSESFSDTVWGAGSACMCVCVCVFVCVCVCVCVCVVSHYPATYVKFKVPARCN